MYKGYLITILQRFALLTCFHSFMAHPTEESFDFVVVGGGTGGCVVAGRLSENGRYSVLLLEAGGVPDPRIDDPALVQDVISEGQLVRFWDSVPQKNVALENNGTVTYIVGHILGGGSGVNTMWFNRGSPFDYDNWARITGDKSWGYANMLKYFKKVENYGGAFPSDQHGIYGHIPVTGSKYTPGMAVWLKAGQQLGYPIADANGPQKISFTTVEHNQKYEKRVSSYYGYVRPFLNVRKNLEVITLAEAIRIEFVGRRAVGVVYRINSTDGTLQLRLVRARREVIVSAGTMGSPILLLKSGIGPKQVLDAAKIPKVLDLPVGRNLKDHVVVYIYFAVNKQSLDLESKRELTPEIFKILTELGEGSNFNWGGTSSQGFTASFVAKSFDGNPNWADTHLAPIFTSDPPSNSSSLAEGEVEAGCAVVLTRPKSHGTVVLNNTNVDSGPVIDFQYLTHPHDMQVLLEGINTALKIFEQTQAYQKVGARFLPHLPPPCQNLQLRSDEYWRCYIRQTSWTFLHAGGTCKMGSGSQDPTGVVDPELRVVGMEGLRVVDASVMPMVPNANTMVPVLGIAEKASDMILRSWERPARESSVYKKEVVGFSSKAE